MVCWIGRNKWFGLVWFGLDWVLGSAHAGLGALFTLRCAVLRRDIWRIDFAQEAAAAVVAKGGTVKQALLPFEGIIHRGEGCCCAGLNL